MEEHCRQAAAALRAWLNRYQAALLHAGGKVETITKAMAALSAAIAGAARSGLMQRQPELDVAYGKKSAKPVGRYRLARITARQSRWVDVR